MPRTAPNELRNASRPGRPYRRAVWIDVEISVWGGESDGIHNCSVSRRVRSVFNTPITQYQDVPSPRHFTGVIRALVRQFDKREKIRNYPQLTDNQISAG